MNKIILTPTFAFSNINIPEDVVKYAVAVTDRFVAELEDYRHSLDVVLSSTSPLFISQVLGDDPYFRSGEKANVEARLECAKIGVLEVFKKAYWENLHSQLAEKLYPNNITHQAALFFSGDEEIGRPYLDFNISNVMEYVKNHVFQPMSKNSAHSVLSDLIHTSKRAVHRVFNLPNDNQLDIVNIEFFNDSLGRKVGISEILTAIIFLNHQQDSVEDRLSIFSAERKNLIDTFFIKEDSKIGILPNEMGGFIRGEYREFLLKFANDLGVDIIKSIPKPL